MGIQSNEHWSTVPTLRGQHVVLAPLSADHVDGLCAALYGSDLHKSWYTNVPAPDAVDAYVSKALAAQAEGRVLPFVVLDSAGQIVGSTRLYDLDATVPSLKIGYTWYVPRVQRTGLNTEAKLLLFKHAFDVLGCVSVVFETSWFNQVSRAAITRLGARQDGVLRNHKRHADGSLRDTVVFSILDQEWPAVRSHLQYKLEQYA